MLRKAFTLIELIFVILIIGILAVVATPYLKQDHIIEARDQVIIHMRYAQHLAITNNSYLSDSNLSMLSTKNERDKESTLWFKKLWQIQFHTTSTSFWAYTVYSDMPSSGAAPRYSGQPDTVDRYASDPQTGLFIARDGINSHINENRLTDVDLAKKYDITKVEVRCPNLSNPTSTSGHILFDDLGRTLCHTGEENVGDLNLMMPFDHLSKDQIKVTLYIDDQNASICVEPESGYIHEC